MNQTSTAVDIRDWVDFSTDGATRRRCLASEHLAVDVWSLQPQSATDVNVDDNDVSLFVVAGHAWIATGDGDIGLDPMGMVVIPAGVEWGIANKAVDPLIVVAHEAGSILRATDSPVALDQVALRDVRKPRSGGLASRVRRLLNHDPMDQQPAG